MNDTAHRVESTGVKRLLVTGVNRSGTTMLANFLNAQPEVVVIRDFFKSLFWTSRQLHIERIDQELGKRARNVLLAELKAEASGMGQSGFDRLKPDFSSLQELYYRGLDVLSAQNPSAAVIGTKVTRCGMWMAELLAKTDLRIIHMTRDMRDVLLSAKNRFADYSLHHYLALYARDAAAARALEHPRLIKIRFEDLILEKDRIVPLISRFLGSTITTDLSSFSDRGLSWNDNSAFHDVSQMFDPKSVYRWKEQPGAPEVLVTEVVYGKELREQGYEVGHRHALLDRLEANTRHAVAMTRRRTRELIRVLRARHSS